MSLRAKGVTNPWLADGVQSPVIQVQVLAGVFGKRVGSSVGQSSRLLSERSRVQFSPDPLVLYYILKEAGQRACLENKFRGSNPLMRLNLL